MSLPDHQIAEALGRIEQKFDSLNERLFDGDASVIRTLQKDIESQQTALDAIKEKHDALQTKVTWYSGIAAGIQIILSVILGVHIGHH